VIDPRFAGLAARFADLTDGTTNDSADGAQPGSGSTDTEEN